MTRFKLTASAAASAAALLVFPTAPAHAGGPLLFAPWLFGHVLAGVIAAAAAPASQPAYPGAYPVAPAYGAAPSYYPPPQSYHAPPPVYPYYRPPQSYYAPPPAFSAPAYSYARVVPGYQERTRGYYAPGMRYSGAYGARIVYPGRSSRYFRRW